MYKPLIATVRLNREEMSLILKAVNFRRELRTHFLEGFLKPCIEESVSTQDNSADLTMTLDELSLLNESLIGVSNSKGLRARFEEARAQLLKFV